MNSIQQLANPHLLNLQPYSSARSEFSGTAKVFLDANENSFGTLNRYPDPLQTALKAKLSELKKTAQEQIFIGNGSDEIIDLTIRLFCATGADTITICPPTYGMYEVSAAINNIRVNRIPLTAEFELDVSKILEQQSKILFLCSPNNPTGNTLKNIEEIVRSYLGIVFIDEAYIEFSTNESWISKLNQFPNVIVSQTFSKAYGLAAARIGVAYASTEIIDLLNKIKPPYNCSSLNVAAALEALSDNEKVMQQIAEIVSERKRLENELVAVPVIEKVFTSDANFLFLKTTNATAIYNQLISRGIVVRNRHNIVENCLRITVGTKQENDLLINILKSIQA
ncbi:histidinol-phosphate transaminase [Flavobacterium aurantiibacter]|uniref:Histidinol-phosphate aminotransferase n=1 Tax=Flavobacterium aurantiibacter TaxID=2023067 RepID=A0A255ZVR2_9FLAO|nr:histidinol-phosphate transaminase [Flavobacterium aurantiibacter]OYQ44850.1 histidinol-phosphate transaminase [Flavobacterium aurantiibacter]